MKHGNFIMKLVSLLLVLGAVWQYQAVALSRAAVVEENAAAVAAAEEYNDQILREASGGTEEDSGYADGSYEGEGSGFGGKITVSVTVKEGVITEIDVLSASGEDPAYYTLAESVLEDILETQSTQVDTVSGATYSSGGLIEAVQNALGKAVE